MNLIPMLLAIAGAFTTAGAVFDWDWFMNSRRAQFLASFFGRKGTRIFYLVLGLFLLVVGLLGVAGGANPPQ
ncbi:MAG: hypothetical protein HN904_25345 [Victivallales bacterium]|jgi:hypothetical protein|nr:hypothetical protein [Victivallales bacterium]MBT7166130.1 hypothetical protein [Victivallales bacterium]